MSLKKELKQTIVDVYKKEGIPMITDKNFITMWETFAKSQPSVTSLAGATYSGEGLDGIPPSKPWETLEFNMGKFGLDPKYNPKIVAILKKKFGENPTQSEIGTFMTT